MRPKENRGILYVVATPIGNLEDITLRAIRVLKEVDLIASEDTRKLKILLKRYEIEKPTISFFEGNEEKRTQELLKLLQKGKHIALLSEAGTPTISDPGYKLVKVASENNIRIIPIPGPNAAITALSASGLPTDSFSFFGFLPPKGSKRKKRLEEIARCKGTIIIYESPRRLLRTLEELLQYCGNRKVCLARELTKLHEEFIRGELSQVIKELKQKNLKGEITIVMEGLGWR
jgi:16S rRNA (cytidine1402-2'-O)-methyltransferase